MSGPGSGEARIGERLFVGLQRLLPQHLLSRLIGALARARWLRRPLIALFLRAYHPDLRDALEPDPRRYSSFNAFFTRALREGARPLADPPSAVVSPVDGTISALGRISAGRLLQAKGHDYSLVALLAGEEALAGQLRDGGFMTIYLAPFNYHRIHMALAGRLCAARYVPGRLFSVNDTTARLVPDLFARNERVVLTFEAACGRYALVMVGALFVGSMSSVWHGDIAPRGGRFSRALALPGPGQPSPLPRGAELGRFNMGSTVILLLPPAAGGWEASLTPGRTLRVGERIGALPGAGPP
ncbi:MAG TPA: archaetidylserine decarboxylase [Steroidobacteraceae bacterium]|nr:archaetidylserine decarboxylase [Steroidobacteraceae bacterium]